MIYYTNPQTGEVFAYETEAERNQWGAPELELMTLERVEAHLNPPASIPTSVSMRQIRLALLHANILDQVEAAISEIEDPIQRREAEIEWEYATTVDRSSRFVQNLSVGLGLSEEQLDELFTTASQL